MLSFCIQAQLKIFHVLHLPLGIILDLQSQACGYPSAYSVQIRMCVKAEQNLKCMLSPKKSIYVYLALKKWESVRNTVVFLLLSKALLERFTNILTNWDTLKVWCKHKFGPNFDCLGLVQEVVYILTPHPPILASQATCSAKALAYFFLYFAWEFSLNSLFLVFFVFFARSVPSKICQRLIMNIDLVCTFKGNTTLI